MYEVEFTSEAEADLARLSKGIAQRILKKLRWLAENFETITPEPLSGQWKGLFKLRVGDYRCSILSTRPSGKLLLFILLNTGGKFTRPISYQADPSLRQDPISKDNRGNDGFHIHSTAKEVMI